MFVAAAIILVLLRAAEPNMNRAVCSELRARRPRQAGAGAGVDFGVTAVLPGAAGGAGCVTL